MFISARQGKSLRSQFQWLAITIGLACSLPLYANQQDMQQADALLNTLHQRAADAQWDGYFSLYRPDAVFIGTDATERWSMSESEGYARPTKGWRYSVDNRKLIQHDNVILFDEQLSSQAYGVCRGTGTLLKTDGNWQIAQYHLSIPIPNDMAKSITAQIKAATKK